MKTTASKENSTSSQSSKPFFNKKAEGGFFALTKEAKQPFFAPHISRQGGAIGGHNFANIPIFPPRSRPVIQTKLTINEPGDKYEQEADAMADRVMRMPERETVLPFSVASGGIQRRCAGCEEEDRQLAQTKPLIQRQTAEEEELQIKPLASGLTPFVQRKSDGGGVASERLTSRINAGRGSGSAMSDSIRSFMESRFGADFSGVRVHTGGEAVQMNRELNAQAFTVGRDVFFGEGKYSPESTAGSGLLAHELAHVMQQDMGRPTTVRRTLAASSSCPANTHGAPADPIGELTAADERAQLMALGTSNVLSLEALTFADPTFGRSYVSDAYERRFGLPPAAVGGRFRNRFTGRLHVTQDEAMREEMLFLSNRFRTLHNFLSGQIRYRCPGASSITLPGCAAATCGGSIAFSCPGSRQIAICPTFWNFPLMLSVDQRGGNMIHESVHMRLGFGPHNLGSVDQRGRNPECHAAIVADIYGFQSDDTTDCTPLIP